MKCDRILLRWKQGYKKEAKRVQRYHCAKTGGDLSKSVECRSGSWARGWQSLFCKKMIQSLFSAMWETFLIIKYMFMYIWNTAVDVRSSQKSLQDDTKLTFISFFSWQDFFFFRCLGCSRASMCNFYHSWWSCSGIDDGASVVVMMMSSCRHNGILEV